MTVACDTETKARINGAQFRMNELKFFFDIVLAELICAT